MFSIFVRKANNVFFSWYYKMYIKAKERNVSEQYNIERLKLGQTGNNCKISLPTLIKNAQYITIGDNFQALHNLRLEAWDKYRGQRFTPQIIIGDNVSFNSDVHIGTIDKVVVGNDVLIASRVYISDHSHGNTDLLSLAKPIRERGLISKGPVIIGDNVWIGEGACILPGVTIGKNSIVGANAVVTKSFPPYSIIAGVPAKLIPGKTD